MLNFICGVSLDVIMAFTPLSFLALNLWIDFTFFRHFFQLMSRTLRLNSNFPAIFNFPEINRGRIMADPNANATLKISHELFLDMVLGSASVKDLIFSDQLSIDGSKIDLARFFALQDQTKEAFEMVLP